MTYKINWIDVNPYIRFKKTTNFGEISAINEFFVGHRNFDRMKYQIWDFIETKELYVDEEELQVIAALDKSSFVWNKKMKIALIAKNKAVIDICLKYKDSMKNTGWSINIFDNLQGAKDWCKRN